MKIASLLILSAALAVHAQNISQTSTGANSPNVVGGNVTQQTPPAPIIPEVLTPKETKHSELDQAHIDKALSIEENLQLKAQIIKADADKTVSDRTLPLQAAYGEQEKLLNDYIAAVKKENGWGNDVTFNRQTRHWERTPKVEPATTEPKK